MTDKEYYFSSIIGALWQSQREPEQVTKQLQPLQIQWVAFLTLVVR